MNKILLTLILVIIIYGTYKIYQQVNIAKDLDRLVAKGAIILDVRTSKEFSEGHINSAINMSLGSIRERYIELDTSKIYITCCSHGLRSIKAVNLLKERGIKKVYNGGIWSDLEEIINENK
ncbi:MULTISPECIES: rhodanese-like domain-containing protein [Aquimarina]|uniref:rhodanese-like domain-containing protein n=1 Tax=Aquimarina TaxID=290174 RepID=UPI000D6957CA|nr:MULTISPECIES: rhodanese-like domain-containing protein [Aquimarina]